MPDPDGAVGTGEDQAARFRRLASEFDESTPLSWLWAFLFGPLYFGYHGFMKRAILLIFLNLILIGFIIAPFLAYPAWRARALERAMEDPDVWT